MPTLLSYLMHAFLISIFLVLFSMHTFSFSGKEESVSSVDVMFSERDSETGSLRVSEPEEMSEGYSFSPFLHPHRQVNGKRIMSSRQIIFVVNGKKKKQRDIKNS